MARRNRAGSGLPRLNISTATEEGGPAAVGALREAGERLHGMAAPGALSPDFLRRDIAYRRQADQHGGLSAETRRRLAALAGGDGSPSSRPRPPTLRIKPGSTLLREWHGRTYTVLALDKGFEVAGQRFASLSDVARHITGAHWSGPRFFGLRRSETPSRPSISIGDAAGA